jgi:hypothetical protein
LLFFCRIFEVTGQSDTKSLNLLTSSAAGHFTSALDYYSNALNSVLLTLKDNSDQNEHAISEIINTQFNLCFFYWSLGMSEVALSEMDSLNATITKLFEEPG